MSVDISNWTLTEHPAQQAIFSSVKIPAGTKLAAGGFYLLGLSNSGLAVPARAGDTTIYVRSTAGMSAGDTIGIDTGSTMETRKIAKHRNGGQQPYDTVATSARGSGDHDSRRLDQRARHEHRPDSLSARRSPSATAPPTPPSQETWSSTRWPR